MDKRKNKIVEIFIEHKNSWFKAYEVKGEYLNSYKSYTYYVIAERELEGCIFASTEIGGVKDIICK